MTSTRHAARAAILASVVGLCASAVSAKDFMVLNGKVVTCAEAFTFRDGPLFRSFALLTAPSEVARNERRAAVRDELSRHIDKLKADWDKKSAAQKRLLYSSLATFAVAEIFKRYAGELPPTADQAMRDYAKEVGKRSVDMQKLVADTGFGNPPSAASVAGLPLATIAIAVPQLRVASTIYGMFVNGIDTAVLFGELYLTNKEYEGTISALQAALAKVIDNSTDLKIAQINQIKNDIDGKCSGA